MRRYVAFLRGMNTGGHRIKNDDLCACFEQLGFRDVSAFLASGNVVFDAARDDATEAAEHIEKGLRSALGYEVPTFLRTADEVRAIAGHEPFDEELVKSAGKLQVALLPREPAKSARRKVLAFATEDDRLAIRGRELYWLPRGGMLDSDLDLARIERTLGPWTVRTKR
ncbi:MAG: DUF1697 domain-containing protein, partial [Planctomycetota bacterium]